MDNEWETGYIYIYVHIEGLVGNSCRYHGHCLLVALWYRGP